MSAPQSPAHGYGASFRLDVAFLLPLAAGNFICAPNGARTCIDSAPAHMVHFVPLA
jgi:hypothetical protein